MRLISGEKLLAWAWVPRIPPPKGLALESRPSSLAFREEDLSFSFRNRRLDIPLASWARGRGRALGVQGRRSTSSFKCVREAVYETRILCVRAAGPRRAEAGRAAHFICCMRGLLCLFLFLITLLFCLSRFFIRSSRRRRKFNGSVSA